MYGSRCYEGLVGNEMAAITMRWWSFSRNLEMVLKFMNYMYVRTDLHKTTPTDWPLMPETVSNMVLCGKKEIPEVSLVHVAAQINVPPLLWSTSSYLYIHLIRIIAWMTRFIQNRRTQYRANSVPRIGTMTTTELDDVETRGIMTTQYLTLAEEITSLQKGGKLSGARLFSLYPFLD